MDEQRKWYDEGLSFACARCSGCCTGGPGYVFLSYRDILSLARFEGKAPKAFIDENCRQVRYGEALRLSLRERKNFDCVYWSDAGCAAYDFRPIQCRTYPFWSEVMASRRSWVLESRHCPGIDSGATIPREEIDRALALNERFKPAEFANAAAVEALHETEILGRARLDPDADDAHARQE